MFPYRPVENALIRTYRVRKGDIGRFRARLTFLQKGGLLGLSPGKGKALRYTPQLIHRMLFAVELAELGATPAQTLNTVSDLWESRIAKFFEDALKGVKKPPGDDDIIMALGSTSLMVGGWMSTAKALPNVNAFPLRRLDANLKLLMGYDDPPPRAIVVNLTARLRAFHTALEAENFREPVALEHPARVRRRRREAT